MSSNIVIISDKTDLSPREVADRNIITTNTFKLYKRRWFMLFLYVICYASTAFQFLQFSIIANIISEFYDVSFETVDWSAIINFVFYVPLVFPIMHIINKIGIRASLLATMFGVCVAAWIKVASAAPDRFWVVMVGQAVVATFQIFVSVLPAQIAAAWFGKDETALACGIAIFGNQLGITLGCYIPTTLIRYSKDKDAVAYDMKVLNIGLAVVCLVVLLSTFAFFRSKPPTPPSEAQRQLEAIGKVQFIKSTKVLFTNSSYILLFVAYAISIGVFFVIPTLLNQIILQYYPDSMDEVSRIGLILNIMGMLASSIVGYVLSKLQKYRLTTITSFVLYLLSMIIFTIGPLLSLVVFYVASVLLGFFMTATFSICLEVAAEITYPVPESTSSGYLLASSQFTAVIFTYLYSYILYKYGALWANIITCIQLLISTILVMCMKFRRQRPVENSHNKDIDV